MSKIRCLECKEEIFKSDAAGMRYRSWLRIMNFLEFANLQGEITNELHDTLNDDLMWLKPKDESE